MNRTPSSVRRLPLGMLLGLALLAGAARPAHATLYASYATALSVSGSDYYQTTSSPFNPNQFAFTAELWFKATSTSGTQVLVSQLNGTGTGRSWLYVKSGVLATGLGGTELLGKTTITPATWHHAALVYDRARHRESLYLDGALDSVGTAWAESATGNLVFGASNGYALNFTGAIDEARFWLRQHGVMQIKKDMSLVLHGNETYLGTSYGWNDGALLQRTVSDKTGFSTYCWSGSTSGYLPAADTAGNTITYAITGQGTLGTTTVDANGKFTYTQTKAGTYGTDSFTYSATAGGSTVTGSVSVYVGKLSLAFTKLISTASPVYGLGAGSFVYFAFADLDGDGDIDTYTHDELGGNISYYKNTGTAYSPSFTKSTSALPTQDWCSGGTQSLDGSGNLQCKLPSGSYVTESSLETGQPFFSLAFYDYAGNGIFDAFSLHHNGYDDAFLYYGNSSSATPSFSNTGTTWISNAASAISFSTLTTLSFADLVGGGYGNPILPLTQSSKPLRMVNNLADGAFSIPAVGSDTLQLDFASNAYLSPTGSAIGDLDGDGDFDIALGGDSASHTNLEVYLNTGSNDAPVFGSSTTSLGSTISFYQPVLADLDGDGDLDLVVGGWGTGVPLYYRNDSSYRFAETAPTASNLALSAAATAVEITGSYSYSDAEGDAESGSTYKWSYADSVGGTNAVTISGATSDILTFSDSQSNKFLQFCVTPSDGTMTGSQACSVWAGFYTDGIGPMISWYADALYAGTSISIPYELLEGSGTCVNLTDYNMNDMASSMKLHAPVNLSATLTWYKDVGCSGSSLTKTAAAGATTSVPKMGAIGWNDMISSFKVTY